jgi:two-component system nitrogen regulation response regulator GlnG
VSAATILIADDDRSIRTVLSRALGRYGHDVRAAGDAATLWKWVVEGEGDLIITDVVLPDGNGLDLIPRIRALRPGLRIIAMSARNTLLTAVRAAEQGAFEYLPKPFDLDELTAIVERALHAPTPADSREHPDSGADQDSEEQLPLIGRSPAMQDVYRVMARLMGTDLTVMIVGESGTGKELVARALHDYGKRKAGPFVAINMAAIPRDLVESELFGHEKGAFTGATARHGGRFEQARGGTLFLDEIGDMPPIAQTRLLRVLQQGEYRAVGGREEIRADVRIIAATHRDLRRLIREGRFREDLYYRLNVVPVRVPPVRERTQDIGPLARHFLSRAAADGLPAKILGDGCVRLLEGHGWPGNVRELENLMYRIAALYADDVIPSEVIEMELVEPDGGDIVALGTSGDDNLGESVGRHLKTYFDAHGQDLPASGLYRRVLREIERPLLRVTLSATRGNQIQAAKLLGLNRNTLRKKLRDLDIDVAKGMK